MTTISNTNPPISMLVVEDEAITLEFLFTTLARKYPHITLHKALNGRTGLEIFKTHTPGIVITDVNMPEINGLQMAEKIRAMRADTRFIVLSGTCKKIFLQDTVRNGFEFDHYIEKPVILQELFDAIELCIREIAGQC